MVLSLSHIDLDGISAQIVLRHTFKEVHNMNISYGKVNEYLDIINDYCLRVQPKEVYITDLLFKYTELEKLSNITKNFPDILFHFIDHHPFGENNSEYKHLITKNFKILISPKASATKLLFLYLQNKKLIKTEKINFLKEYVDYVDVYDLWKLEHNKFKIGFLYNELFWKYKKEHYFSRFKDDLKIRNSDKEVYKELIKKKTKLFSKLEKSGRVMKFSNRILLIFLDDFQGHVTIDYPNFLSYIIVRSDGGVSIRFDKDISSSGDIKNNIVKEITKLEYINEAGGHNSAMGTRIQNPTPEKLISFSKILVHEIDKELEKINK